MATDYVIQKGDTLGALAKKFGVGISDISGYKSNDPNKIYAGETIKIGKVTPPASSTYMGEVKTQLGAMDNTDKTNTDKTNTNGSSNTTDDYGLSSLRTKITDAQTKRDASFAELKNISTKTFNDEYTKRGLADKKTKLSNLDNEIATAKQQRDEAIAKVRSNPGLSAAQMTGDAKKIADYQNDVINNKIAERNSVAGEYNSELGEIDRLVTNTVKDKSLEYGYYDSTLKDLNDRVSDYQKNLREELSDATKSDQFDRQLEQALQIAQMNANKKGSNSSNLQLKSDPRTGDPLYWFDPDTGEITYINGNDGADNQDSFDNLPNAVEQNQNISSNKKWYNPLTWFQ